MCVYDPRPYIYTYIHIYLCVRACVRAYTIYIQYVCVCVCVCVYDPRPYTYTYIHTLRNPYAYSQTPMHVCTHTHVDTSKHVYTYPTLVWVKAWAFFCPF